MTAQLLRGWVGFSSIEIAFPAFRDGRGYSNARILREAGYAGELRAEGDVLTDQASAPATAIVQSAIEITLPDVVPVGLGMTQQAEALHVVSVVPFAACPSPSMRGGSPSHRRSASRCKASSSVTRNTGVPAGKAPSNRLGKAGESTTK